MRYLHITYLFFSILPFLAQSQNDTLAVSGTYGFPDIHPDSLFQFIDNIATFDSIQQNEVPYDKLTSNERTIFEKQALYEHGPFYTGAYGCSWYCVNKPTSINASPFIIKATKIEDYIPENVHDFDLRTAWITNLKKDPTPNITFHFDISKDSQQLDIIIYNGFSKNTSVWKNYSRAKTIEVTIQHNTYILKAQDHYYGQVFKIPYQLIGYQNQTAINFKITEVYGNKKKPLAISEINFDGSNIH